MTRNSDEIRRHYEGADDAAGLVAGIAAAIEGLGRSVTTTQLAALDQFHVRGLAATIDLGKLLEIASGDEVLDAGSGLGGPSRALAEIHGCRVTGVDLSPAYVNIATMLAEQTGLHRLVTYLVGNLLARDFPDQTFDVVYTQHVVMNIGDRERVYRGIRRVLKPTGRFGFYDVLAVDGRPEPLYPLPWAQTAETSFLLTEEETRSALHQAGLTPEVWTDVTAEALAWFGQPRSPAASLNLSAVMGPRFGQMTANLAHNLVEGRLRLVMARCLPQA